MKKVIVIALSALVPNLVFAHADHAPRVAQCAAKECTKEEIEANVPTSVQALVKAGKIEGNWATAKVESVEKKTFKKEPEWVVTLLDSNQKDQSKQRLYIFITTKGYLNGSNFSGK